MTTFEEAWAKKAAKGYQYGDDALEQVHFGWEIAREEMAASLAQLVKEFYASHERGPAEPNAWGDAAEMLEDFLKDDK